MNIYIIKKDTFEDLEVVGEYGTFHNPVVMYNDKEIVAEYYDIAFPANAVAEMKIQTDALDSLNEAETRKILRSLPFPHQQV